MPNNKLIEELGVNVHQVFETGAVANTQSRMPACVIGPWYQIKTDEPVNVADMQTYSATNKVFNALTSEIVDADLVNVYGVTTVHKVMITAPTHLQGAYAIDVVDTANGKLKVSNPNILATVGAQDVAYYIYNPSKLYGGRGVNAIYPGLVRNEDATKTSLVDEPSVIVKIKDINGSHVIPRSTSVKSFTGLSFNGTAKTLGQSDFSAVEVGQHVLVTAPAILAGFHKVTAVTPGANAGEDTITITPDNGIATAVNVADVSGVIYTTGVVTTPETFYLTPGITYRGQILVSYRALRRDYLYTFLRVQRLTDLTSLDCRIDTPDNPLGYGLGYMMKNSGETVEIFGLPTEGDRADYHQKAADYLYLKKQAYYLVPLTQEREYAQIYANSALTVSQPYERWYANAILNFKVPMYTAVRTAGSTFGPALDNAVVKIAYAANKITLTDELPGTDLEVLDIPAGSFLKIKFELDDVLYTVECPVVANSVTRNTIQCATNAADSDLGGATMGDFTNALIYKYEIISEYFDTSSSTDKAKQASALASQIESLATSLADGFGEVSSRRVLVCAPDLLESDQGHIVPGYYFACMVAGLKAALPAQQPISEWPIVGVRRFIHSTEYFSNVQIRTIESAGCMVGYQPVEGAAGRVRHQLTTDLTNINTMEWSINTAVDSFSIRITQSICSLIGRSNITTNLLLTLRAYIEGYFAKGVAAGEIRGGTIMRLEEDTQNPGHVYIQLKVDTLKPFNQADIWIYV